MGQLGLIEESLSDDGSMTGRGYERICVAYFKKYDGQPYTVLSNTNESSTTK